MVHRDQWQQRLAQCVPDTGAADMSAIDWHAAHWADLSDHDILYISGKDAASFLQGQITCHIDDLDNTQAHLGAYCNPQGRVIALFHISRFRQGFLLWLSANMGTVLHQALRPYIMRSDVHIQQLNDEITSVGLCGDLSLWQHWIEQPPQQLHGKTQSSTHTDVQLIQVDNTQPRYVLIIPWAELITWSTQQPLTDGLLAPPMWPQCDCQQGMPQLTAETSGLMTPAMLNLLELDAINFKKGCFCGQEVIARTHYRGQNKRHLSLWQAPHACAAGTTCHNAQEERMGHVLQCVPHQDHYWIQAVVHQRALNEGLYTKNQPHAKLTLLSVPSVKD